MAGGFPIGLSLGSGSSVAISSGSRQGTVTSSTTANSLGSYSTLVASTPFNAGWIHISIGSTFINAGTVVAMNLALGASGSERVIIPNLVLGANGTNVTAIYSFPCSIPAGTRISANLQSNVASAASVNVNVTLFPSALGSFSAAGLVDTYGFNASTTNGTLIDPGATANTKPASFTQLTAATTKDLIGFVLGFDGIGTGSGSTAGWYGTLDLAIGSGNQIILPDYSLTGLSSLNSWRGIIPGNTPFYPIPIPAGTSISARAQSTTNVSGARQFDITLYGVRA